MRRVIARSKVHVSPKWNLRAGPAGRLRAAGERRRFEIRALRLQRGERVRRRAHLRATGSSTGIERRLRSRVLSGVCLTACNPCAPTRVRLGETCFARTPRPCSAPRARCRQGAPCGYAVTPAPCAAGLTCAEVFEQAGRTCVRHCRPDPTRRASAHEDPARRPARTAVRRSMLRNRLELASRGVHRFRVRPRHIGRRRRGLRRRSILPAARTLHRRRLHALSRSGW